MEKEKIELIIETIESQLKLLKLELGKDPDNKIELNLEDLIKSDPFAAYNPSYHEED